MLSVNIFGRRTSAAAGMALAMTQADKIRRSW
jgi:hypothetical protein